MNLSILLVLPTRIEATLTIIALLVGAGIIGYVTAWLYYRHIRDMKEKEKAAEREDVRVQILNLHADNMHLQKMLRQKSSEMKHLTDRIAALRGLHKEAVHETDAAKLTVKRTEQELQLKNEALLRIAKRKHLLDYQSFGTATPEERDDLQMISGIGPFIEEKLHAIDIFTFRQISSFTPRDIETIDEVIEYFSGRITRDEWVPQANELVQNKDKRLEMLNRIRGKRSNISYERIGVAHTEEADDLTDISGIGKWINEKLGALDIHTFKQISKFTDEDVENVTEALEFFPGRIERDEWIEQAKDLVRMAGRKADLIKRIGERKERIFYDRLGVAHQHDANNLTRINGIGLWIEERLNALDIYTLGQISKLTPEDVKTITEILEIPEGRIEKDQWIDQAKALMTQQLVLV